MASELVHEIDSEIDSSIQNLKAKLNGTPHLSSNVNLTLDTLESVANNIGGDLTNHSSYVSDETLVKSNTVPYIYANEGLPNHFQDTFATPYKTSNDEKFYQIKLLSAPDRRRVYLGEARDNQNTEIVTMMMLVLLVVIVAVILHLVVTEAERSTQIDEQTFYLLRAQKNNSDPDLREMRYMHIPSQQTCNIM